MKRNLAILAITAVSIGIALMMLGTEQAGEPGQPAAAREAEPPMASETALAVIENACADDDVEAPEAGREALPAAKPAEKPATQHRTPTAPPRRVTNYTRKPPPELPPGNAETVPVDVEVAAPAPTPSPPPPVAQDLAQQERHVDEVLMEVRSLRKTLVDEQAEQDAPERRQTER